MVRDVGCSPPAHALRCLSALCRQVINFPLPDEEARRLIMQRFAKQLTEQELEVGDV